MKSLFTVFIDGLKPESVKYMPFLNSFQTKRRLRTELGYSPTCDASMFSGVYPNKHLHWFSWRYSPDTSPYRWLRKYRLDKLPHNVFTRYACQKVTNFMADTVTAPEGVMNLQWWYIPVLAWHYFDVAVKKHWSEPNFIDGYSTVFEILQANGVPYEIGGLGRGDRIEQYNLNGVKPWTLFFIGDIDHLSHHYTAGSSLVIERLKQIDAILQEQYNLLEKKVGDFCFMVFSDHGHIEIREHIDLKTIFGSCGESLDDYIYCLDANFARFWFRDEGEEQRVKKVLSQLDGKGFILSEEHLQKYHVSMPDNRYGDLIFYVDVPCHLTTMPSSVAARNLIKTRFVSMHGYLPDYPDCDGVFISNKEARECSHVELIDIMPSILDVFDIEIPAYVDGRVIWR
jgi:hypothetical protein